MDQEKNWEQAYRLAEEQFADVGVSTEAALTRMDKVVLSLPCWQGDDVVGFESLNEIHSGGGILSTGNYPGRARNGDELRQDFDTAFSLIPGRHRANLHAIYAEPSRPVGREAIEPAHFQGWIDWARDKKLGLDFNPTFFAHEKASDGFTLSHPDAEIRRFWIDHGKVSRTISEAMGRSLQDVCIMNTWVPDGFKDTPVGRADYRRRLMESLDTMLADKKDARFHKDAVESKLFGIGSESCVVGSHEFYLGYALTRKVMVCFDMGHFHPTEHVADKISSALLFGDELLLHVSRPVRWDSDHVVILDQELEDLASEIVRGGFEGRVHIGLDFFDATINRVAAWVVGARNVQKAFLRAYLEPTEILKRREVEKDYTERLVRLEEARSLPWSAVWDWYCFTRKAPVGFAWFETVRGYEQKVQSRRNP